MGQVVCLLSVETEDTTGILRSNGIKHVMQCREGVAYQIRKCLLKAILWTDSSMNKNTSYLNFPVPIPVNATAAPNWNPGKDDTGRSSGNTACIRDANTRAEGRANWKSIAWSCAFCSCVHWSDITKLIGYSQITGSKATLNQKAAINQPSLESLTQWNNPLYLIVISHN